MLGVSWLIGSIGFEGVSEIGKGASSSAGLEVLEGAEHDVRVNVNSVFIDPVAGLLVLGLIGCGFRVPGSG